MGPLLFHAYSGRIVSAAERRNCDSPATEGGCVPVVLLKKIVLILRATRPN